jgi:hypothetical protein
MIARALMKIDASSCASTLRLDTRLGALRTREVTSQNIDPQLPPWAHQVSPAPGLPAAAAPEK